MSLKLDVPGGKSCRVTHLLNAKEIQFVASLACLDAQSKGANRLDKLWEHIFGYGRDDEDATPKKLQDALDSAKKEIRRQLWQATQQVNQVYSAYYKLLKTISAKAWEPSKETRQDLEGAQAQTNTYRFPARVMSHELSPPHLETDGRS